MAKKKVPKTKTFKGKRYQKWSVWKSRRAALRAAKSIRKAGKNAHVVTIQKERMKRGKYHYAGKHVIYVRRKR
ncbi:MAG: hypothetical protein ACXAEN_27095 [Candidatus Thorarchaeota archaeon]|jgi:hypothetical protein